MGQSRAEWPGVAGSPARHLRHRFPAPGRPDPPGRGLRRQCPAHRNHGQRAGIELIGEKKEASPDAVKELLPLRQGVADTTLRARVCQEVDECFGDHFAAMQSEESLGSALQAVSEMWYSLKSLFYFN